MNKRLQLFSLNSLITFSIVFSGCATIFSGSTDTVELSSEPTGAQVYVNGAKRGTTPVTLTLKKGREYNLEFRKDQYETKGMALNYSLGAGWLVLDILSGLVGIIVDAATGNWNGFELDKYKAILEPLK